MRDNTYWRNPSDGHLSVATNDKEEYALQAVGYSQISKEEYRLATTLPPKGKVVKDPTFWQNERGHVRIAGDRQDEIISERQGRKQVDQAAYDAYVGRRGTEGVVPAPIEFELSREDRDLLRAALLVFRLEQDKARGFQMFLEIAHGAAEVYTQPEHRFISGERIHRLYQRLEG